MIKKDDIGARICLLRKQKFGIRSRSHFARLCGFSPKTILRIERGLFYPSLKDLVGICSVLEVTPNDILGFKNKKRGIKLSAPPIIDEMCVLPKGSEGITGE